MLLPRLRKELSGKGVRALIKMGKKAIIAEIPEELARNLESYLASRPDLTKDRLLTAAIAHFLVQNQKGDGLVSRQNARTYLDALFKKE